MYRAGKLNHLNFLSRISYPQNEREEDLVPTQEPFLDAIISRNNNDVDDQISNIQDKDNQVNHQTRRYESLQLAATQHVPTQAQACCSEVLEKEIKLDPILQSIINYIENNTLPEDEKLARQIVLQADNFTYIHNLLYHIQKQRKQTSNTANLQLCIPLNLRQPILVAHHDGLSHIATQNTYSLITKRFYWQGMYRDVHDYVQSCTTCIQH